MSADKSGHASGVPSDDQKKQKNGQIWRDPRFRARARELIKEGILVSENAEALRKKLNEEFADYLNISQKTFLKRYEDDLVWSDKDDVGLVMQAVRYDYPLGPIYKLLRHLPQALIDRKAKQLRGRTPTGQPKKDEIFEAGVGRLATDAEVARGVVHPLNRYTYEKPFEIAVKDQDNFNMMFVIPHVGAQYPRVIDQNPVRNMVRYAEWLKFDAIVIPAGLLWLDLTRAGNLITHRAEISGLEMEKDFMDPEYREKALAIKKTLPPNKVVFITLRERVMSAIFAGYRKIFLHKDGSPIFSGRVYFSFGRPEEDLIEAASAAHLTYIQRIMLHEVSLERRATVSRFNYVRKSRGITSPEAQKLQLEVDRFTREEQRYRVMNVDHEDRQRYTGVIRSLIVSWLKEAIPNSEFITQGNAILSVGGAQGKIMSLAQESDIRAEDNAVARAVESAGVRELSGRMPDVEILSGAYSLNMRYSTRTRMLKEQGETHVVQVPVAIDRDYVKKALKHLLRKATPYERLINSARFEPGALHVQYTDGMWIFGKLDMRMFRDRYVLGLAKVETSNLFTLANGDVHTGSRSQRWFRDKETGEMLTMEVAFARIFTRNFTEKGKPLPISEFVDTGDQTQGHHFETQHGVHPKQRSIIQEQKRGRALLEKAARMSEAELRAALQDAIEEHISQLAVRGEDWPTRQIVDHMHSIRARATMFLEILKTHARAKVKLIGMGEARLDSRGTVFDARDIGALSFLGGNHLENTTNGEVSEGPIFATYAIARILALKECNFSEEELERLVRAPLWGDISMGYGLLATPDQKRGYTWGMQIRHDPARKSKQNADPLLNELRNVIETGNYSRIFGEKEWIGINGDVHRMGAAFGPGFTLVSCGSCTDGDHYGAKHGFSRVTSGAMVVGRPAWGPASGPIRIIPIMHDFIRRYLEKPWEIRWKEIFRNAL